MKRITFVLLSCLMSLTIWAAKANPEPMTFVQSDGSEITVRLYGDEHFSWYATMDGILLVRNGNDFFVAEVDENGDLAATAQRAHNDGQRTAQERNVMKAQRRDFFFSEKADRRRAALRRVPVGNAAPPYFPHKGSPTAIVILVNFADTTFVVNDPVKTFNQYLNGDDQQDFGHHEHMNSCSVRQYFEDISFGQFSPKFNVIGPVTVSKGMAYYGANSGTTKDKNYLEMLKEACRLARQQELVDFTDPIYDSDGDGNIDLVYFVYAGYGESNGAPSNTIWPKSSYTSINLDDADMKPAEDTPDCGKIIRRFGLNNELNGYWGHSFYKVDGRPEKFVNGIGLFCHEFSHTMGLPDFYPYNASARTVSNQEMEMWSLMDGGEYLNYGYNPAAYTAWEREAMSWLEVETLSENQHIDIMPIDDNGKAYRIVNPADENEYMMIENIQQQGRNKEALGHGLLVYHVQWSATSVNLNDRPNDTKDYPRMAVVPADGLLFSSYLVGTQEPWGTDVRYKRDANNQIVLDENGKPIIEKDHIVTKANYETHHAGDPFPGKNDIAELGWNLQLPNYVWYTPAKPEDATNEEYSAIKKYPVYQTLKNITEDINTGVVSFDFYTDYTTGIETVNSPLPTSLLRGGNETVYDLQGRMVADNLSSLISHPSSKKGIYIINGKKVVIR